MPSINESANDYTQITSSTNINMSTVSPYVKRFETSALLIFTTLFRHLFKRWFMLRYSEVNVLNFKAWNPGPRSSVFVCVQ